MNLKGKTVLLRIDVNSPVVKGRIIVSKRFEAHARTIKQFSEKGARTVLLAHQGRKGRRDFTQLMQHARKLSQLSKLRINYVDDVYGRTALEEIRGMKNGEVIMLKNTRTMKVETSKTDFSKTSFVKNLSNVSDVFVLDAFSVAHRAHASVIGFVGSVPCYQGPNLSREIENLSKLRKPRKPFTMILGGAKIEEVITVMKNLGKTADHILLYGALGDVILRKRGLNFGKKNELLDNYEVKKLSMHGKKVMLPKDYTLENGEIRTLKQLPAQYNTMDIGPKTVQEARRVIKKSKTVLMKGPVGFAEEGFAKGTKEILQAIKNAGCKAILGGGHLITALVKTGFKEHVFTHVSLGGGSLVEFLSGKKLPGVERIPEKL